MKRRLFTLILMVGLALPGCKPAAPAETPGQAESTYAYQIPPETGDGWETASLQEAGLDPGKLAAMMDDIQDGGFDSLHSLLIVKDGSLVFTEKVSSEPCRLVFSPQFLPWLGSSPFLLFRLFVGSCSVLTYPARCSG
jgi:hypothetical protein